MKRRNIILAIIISIIIPILVAFVINLLFKIPVKGIFKAEWQAEDALIYTGGILGSISTFILGYIAYYQNTKLHDLENRNFIANNSALFIINQITIKTKAKIPVCVDAHFEQILAEKEYNDSLQFGFELTIIGKKIGNAIPAMIHISKATIFIGNSNNELEVSVFTHNKQNSTVFSRMAIGKDDISASLTFMMDAMKERAFLSALEKNKDKGCLIIEFDYSIMTDKLVATNSRCRSSGVYSINDNKLFWKADDPKVFYYGHEIYESDAITIQGCNTI